eukprot:gnl/MRDRNA2_/MRDRNA2_238602_c0_seq1.p1 gnl/MRDRNA2_/MRDRNA2_238602_c0~~gnl/MRDRNA2_/MRDRNA2_238602_c0_seq1.p1  ORF type:complete len:206 (+),score=30.49 gnl/MRDRNA2_/MRDRNA2_238602_c0_seq1:206-823(+)
MTGWAKDQGTMGSMLKLLGDPRSEFTKSLGLVLDDPGAMAVLGNPRCKRFSMYVDDCTIKTLTVAEGDVPAEDTFVDKVLEGISGAGAALQYPVPAMRASPAARSSTVTQASFAAGARPPAMGFRAAPQLAQPPRSAKMPPSMLRSPPKVAQQFARPFLAESAYTQDITAPLVIIGLVVSSGVAFFAVWSRRVAPRAMREPFLEA